MYYSLSLISGFLIAVMVSLNGSLAQHYGMHFSAVFVHLTGLVFITAVVLKKGEFKHIKRHKWYLYSGGALGVFTLISNNVAFGRISVSALLATVLFGQSVAGLLFDQFGWLDSPKNPFSKGRIIGLLLIVAGIAVMIDHFNTIAVLLSFLAGGSLVLSRTINAKLAGLSTVGLGTFFNYLVGFIITIPVFFLFGRNEPVFANLTISPEPLIYFGGLIGVCLIFINNIVVPKVPAFYLSLIMFIGQVLMGVVIDAMIAQSFSFTILSGGILVAIGLCSDLLLNRRKKIPK